MHTTKGLSWLIALILTLSPLAPPTLAHDTDEDRIALELTGEVINQAATGSAPLGSSQQFGYLAFVKGIDLVFTDTNPANQNETTALFTFFTDVQTTRVTTHGPFTITIREGTTTLYLNTPPSSFSNPDSFRSGTPIQTSTIRQQVIVDNVEKTFTVTNLYSERSDPANRYCWAGVQDVAPGRSVCSRRGHAATDRPLCRLCRRSFQKQ
jgi:hypothetical protein